MSNDSLERTMKTRAALALSVAGILVTGSAALAVNTQVLNSTPAGTGTANRVLLPSSSDRMPAPAAVVSTEATPDVASAFKGGGAASACAKPADGAQSAGGGADKCGGRRTGPSTEPANDRGTRAGTVTGEDDAGPARSQPPGTAGAVPAAGSPAVVVRPGDDKGGLRMAPEPGDDKGGQRNTAEPGEDSGGHGSDN